MEFVPFAFCDDVASTLPTIVITSLDAVFAKQSVWRSAFADHRAKRIYLSVNVGFKDGKWFYKLRKSVAGLYSDYYIDITVSEVQKTQRKYVHLRIVGFGNYCFGSALSLDEIRSHLKDLSWSVGRSTRLDLFPPKSPKEAIAGLLSSLSSAPFNEITVWGYEEGFEEFLRKQIKLGALTTFNINDGFPPARELKAEFERIRRLKLG